MTAGRVFIPGTPRPQGSARAFVVKGRAVVTGANAKTSPWRADIHAKMLAAIGDRILIPEGPVAIGLEFVMPRRAAEPKRVTPAHSRKPDGDKLERAVWDALTGVLFTDDSQIDVWGGMKRTAAVGEQPGVWVQWSAGDDSEPRAATPTACLEPSRTEKTQNPALGAI